MKECTTHHFACDCREAKFREANAMIDRLENKLKECASLVDTDFMRSLSENGDILYWVSNQDLQDICDEALDELKKWRESI